MASRDRRLFLHEEVMLLALRNDRGTIKGGTMYAQAAGGAILAELLLRGRVTTVSEGRHTYAVVSDSSPVGDPVIDEALEKMRTSSRRRHLQAWVERFAKIKRMKHRVATGLAERGILRATEAQVLLLFTRRVYPELDSTVERAIVERLREAISGEGKTVDPRTTVLAALAHHAGLLKANLDKRWLKERRSRIEAIIKGDAVGKATKAAIQAAQAAVVMVGTLPIVFAGSGGH